MPVLNVEDLEGEWELCNKSTALQKVQPTDSSVNYPNPDTLKAPEKPQLTRCGRPVKKPDKLNLLNLTDVFD
ncbi:hypothetical protein TNIN_221921 [Trichonephila inaurata madagascariensis]|uniref:Uncharacterized protein n=1 Tax=Trichonephila inaurata madagascariensis TaxID=2747483 RepID=A0A8X7BWG2_9ARAC|nr:hypothetical protein TNIN_221921 [Trichonephila inaurata madagascariensis]